MSYTVLDMETYPRRAHFDYFRSMAQPYAGVTRQVDVTQLYRAAKQNGWPLFLTTLYAVTRAANSVEELRQRIKDGGIVEYDWARPSYTVALENGTYCYCVLSERAQDARAYIEYGKRQQALAVQNRSLEDSENGEEQGDLLFISCLPWLDYTALTQPTPSPADSNPRITWGRICEQGGQWLMPMTLLVNHALADGLHMARFFEAFERELISLS